MIERAQEASEVGRLLRNFPVVGVIGARQVGKTTLARQLLARRTGQTTFFDLEDPVDLRRLDDAGMALRSLRGLVVIDEVQHRPDLFPILRVLADRPRTPARFLVLGSASPELLRQSSESLAGRIAYHELRGFRLGEIGAENLRRLWLRGSFPKSYLGQSNRRSQEWRREFIMTFLERDLPQFGITVSSKTMHRFWTMLAHYHGQTWNSSEFARSFGVSDPTVRRYLDHLSATFVVRLLLPWKENVGKRQVRAPKVYVADSGILHTLLNLDSQRDLEGHPKLGASWEGFIIDQVVQHLRARPEECFFWATHSGAELDLLVVRGRRRLGIEVKHTEAPAVTPSMRHALADLKLSRLDVIHAGEQTWPLGPKIRAVAARHLLEEVRPL